MRRKNNISTSFYIMASLHTYEFNNIGRIGNDYSDRTQRNIMNTKFNNYMLSNYFSEMNSRDFVNFGTTQPALMFRGIAGGSASGGILGSNVDVDTTFGRRLDTRPEEKLMLNPRPFVTVPYLGRGSADPTLESDLRQGKVITNKKSVSTITEKTFLDNHMYPLMDDIKSTVTNPQYLIQEAAMDGWVRGGSSTRSALSSK